MSNDPSTGFTASLQTYGVLGAGDRSIQVIRKGASVPVQKTVTINGHDPDAYGDNIKRLLVHLLVWDGDDFSEETARDLGRLEIGLPEGCSDPRVTVTMFLDEEGMLRCTVKHDESGTEETVRLAVPIAVEAPDPDSRGVQYLAGARSRDSGGGCLIARVSSEQRRRGCF